MAQLNVSVKLNTVYKEYLDRPERYQVFMGGAGSGKSHFLAHNLIISLLKKQQKLLVIRQVYATVRDSVFAELMTALGAMGLTQHIKLSKTTFNIKFPNGSEIIFKGADDESKLLSISGIDLVWVEEASEITQDLFNQLELRLRGGSNKKRFFLSFNPISEQHWLKGYFFDNPKEDSFTLKTTYLDNKYLDQAYIDNLLEMKERNYEKYRVYALGEWGQLGKPVFENYRMEAFDVQQLIKDRLIPVFGGDFGYVADPSTVVFGMVDQEKRELYICGEIYEHGLLNNELAAKIKSKGWARERIIFDSSEQKSIAEMRTYGLPRIEGAKKGAGSIAHGLGYIQQFDVIIHPDCPNVFNEFSQYSYKKDQRTGQYLQTPVDNFNHTIDALRYALEPLSTALPRRSRTNISKRALGL